MHLGARCFFVLLLAVSALTTFASARIIDLETHRFDASEGEPALAADLRATAADYAEDGYFLVQIDGPISVAWREALTGCGATIYGYIPEFAFVVGLDSGAQEAVTALGDVSWVGLYHPAYKISPHIGNADFVNPERRDDPNFRLMIRVFRNAPSVAQDLEGLGCTFLDQTDDGFSRRILASVPGDQIAPIARIKDVWWIEEQPEFLVMNNTTKWVTQSNSSGWTPLWDHGVNGEGQLATIMDSGVDYNSCWFRENGGAAPGPSHRKVINYATFGGGVPYDGCDIGHGSHVAGTMCGDQSYINPGNYNYNGMAYKAKMTVQDIGTDDWAGCELGVVEVPSSLSAPFNAAYNLGARVHQNSWGSTSNTYDGYCVDIDNMMWNHKEFLVDFAAGNGGPGGSTVGSPGTAKDCVTVGATRQAPSQDTIASYSSRGPASDGRYKPTVTAPGGESPNYITSVNNHTGNPPAQTCATASSPFQGTSMATPCVSGMVLNTQQYFADGYYPLGASGGDDPFFPSAALVKATLISSTDDMSTGDIPNNNEGWGRILMDDALYFDGDTRELMALDVTPGVSTGENWDYEFDVESSSEPLVVTLVWTDYPGTSGGGVKLVNNLNLTVTAPGGAQYKGNVFSGGFSSSGGSADYLNVEECARFASPATGTWHVRVTGYNVPHAPQPFAVVINGAFLDWPLPDFSDAGDEPLVLRSAVISAHPNPVTQQTQLSYAVPSEYTGWVTVDIVDVSGRVVRNLVGKGQRPGDYLVTWDGLDNQRCPVTDGVYFATMTAGSSLATTRVVVQR